jgi:hypothetical protein
MAREFSVVAIVSAYNEEDIVAQAIGHLVDQGVHVYLLDHASTDDTVNEAKPYLGRGLLEIETLPSPGAGTPPDAREFTWEAILRRKEALARDLDADWFIHHDADEFRESPWAGIRLRDAIQRVDHLGYNAIDFEVFNFLPTHDRFQRGDDVREAFTFYESPRDCDRLQVKSWRKVAPVDLVSTGGHDAAFEGRRVFPIRFILRHYPIRSQAHGERKVFRERRPRFAPEHTRGWHIQYDGIEEGHCFLRDPATLLAYDPDTARLRLCLEHRGVEELRRTLDETRRVADDTVKALRRDVDHLTQVLEIRERATQAQLADVRGELAAVYGSRSWRWMAPLRAAQRLLHGP